MNLQDLLNNTKSFLTKPRGEAAARFENSSNALLNRFNQGVINAPRFNFAEKIQNPFGRTAAQFGQVMLNIPSDIMSSYGKTFQNINQGETRKAIGSAGELGLNMSQMIPITKGISFAKRGMMQAGKQVPRLTQLIKQGARQGAVMGGGYGAGYGLTGSLQDGSTNLQTFGNTLKQGAIGSLAVGALGGGLPIGGSAGKALFHDIRVKLGKSYGKPRIEPGIEVINGKKFYGQRVDPNKMQSPEVFRQIGQALPRTGLSLKTVGGGKKTNPLIQEARKPIDQIYKEQKLADALGLPEIPKKSGLSVINYSNELKRRGYSPKNIAKIGFQEGKNLIEQGINQDQWLKKRASFSARAEKDSNIISKGILKEVNSAPETPGMDVAKKVNFLDYVRTPDRVLKKIGLEREAKGIRKADEAYKNTLLKEIDKVNEWYKQAPSKESSQRIFKYLDGQKVDLPENEMKIADGIKEYLSKWADRLGLPHDKRVSNYITRLFDEDIVKKEFDPNLAKLIAEDVPGSVYDPFLQKRSGAIGYKEDVWGALDAYIKRATRKEAMDPALFDLKNKGEFLDLDSYNYVKKYADRINLRPTDVDNLLDNFIKTTPIGYKLGQRPTNRITRTWRNAIYRGTLGLNVGSALRNLTQGMNTFAKLGSKNTFKGYATLFKKMAANDLDELNKVGVLQDNIVQDRAKNIFKGLGEKSEKVLWSFFDMAEKINRGSAYFGAKAEALSRGMKKDAAIEYAKKIVRDTQFTFGSIDTPVALSSDLAKTVAQLQNFNIKQTEFLAGMIKNKEYGGLVRFLGASVFMAATFGKLFGMDWKEGIPWAETLTGERRFTTPTGEIIKNAKGLLSTDEETRKEAIRNLPKSAAMLIPGGVQARKTIGGLKDTSKGYSESTSGRVRFPIDQKTSNKARAALFGTWTLPESRKYFDKERQVLGETQSEVLKKLPNEERKSFYENTMQERESKKETAKQISIIKGEEKPSIFDVLKPKVQAAKQESGDIYELSDGKVYAKSLDKTFKTREQAEFEIAKDNFASSDKNIQIVGNRVLRKRKDGTVYSQSKSVYETQLINKKLNVAEDKKDLESWKKYAEEKYQKLQEQMNDPNIDELERLKIQDQIDTMARDLAKYSSYGGFTKPKKGKKSSSSSFKIKGFDMPKISGVSGKIKLSAPPKRKRLKLSTKKVKIKFNKTQAPSASKRLV